MIGGDHIEHFDQQSAEFVDLASSADLSRPVPGCDDWTGRDVIAHVSELWRWADEIVSTDQLEATWPDARASTPPDASLIDWISERRESVVATFRTHDLSRPIWGWAGDRRGWFWPRRMLFEVVVHKTDLERSIAVPTDIDPELLIEGIDEHLSILPWIVWDSAVAGLTGAFETIALEPTDGPRWRITLFPGGFTWDRSNAEADAAVRGSLLDVYMHTQGRPNDCEIVGDADLHQRTLGALSF